VVAQAEQKKYAFHNYPGLRSTDDFAKGVILQKRKLKENMLKWQSTQIPRSLTELDGEHSKLAVQVHKSLLGYMGDKQMQYPATLAQDILQKVCGSRHAGLAHLCLVVKGTGEAQAA
jgi:hypothetical protein